MSLDKELESIPKQTLASDLPDKITAKCLSIAKALKTGTYAGAPILKAELLLEDGTKFSTTYRIPKARTGKSQLEKLESELEKMHLRISDMPGKTFVWQRMQLESSVKGNDRHYPIKVVK